MKITFKPNKITAKEKNKIIGYLNFSYCNDASKKRNLSIEYIFVDPTCRRMGIGTKLIESLFTKYEKKIVWISLWTGLESEKNKYWSIYEKLGFKQIAYQEDYYQKGIATRLFVKKINNF
jgi:ribosomal protein S18 acetylase RimI-like enzyme